MLTFIYIFFEDVKKKKQKTSVTHYEKDLDSGLLHSIAKGDETSL